MIKYKHVVVIPNTGEQPTIYYCVRIFYLEEPFLSLWFGKPDSYYNIPTDLISKIIVTTVARRSFFE
jgi:hypothetical protein